MKPLKLKLNLLEVIKDKIVDGEYQNKEGQTIKTKTLDVDIFELKERKFVKETDKWTMYKTHIASHPQTPEEREQKIYGKVVGNVVEYEYKNSNQPKKSESEIMLEDCPF